MKGFRAFKKRNFYKHIRSHEQRQTFQKKETFLKKSMEFFSSSHLKLLAMVRAKVSSFREQQKEKVKDHYLRWCLSSSWRRKEDEDDSSKVVVVAISSGDDESSCVLEEMKVWVFESYLQRPKDVTFEGLVMRVWLWCWWRKEEEEEEKESFLEECLGENVSL